MTALFCRGARIAPARDVIILAWASYVSLCRRTAGKPLVGKRVRQSFENVNNHNYDELLEAVAPHVHHRFAGAYSIGGALWLCRGCIGVGTLEFSEAHMRWRGLAVLLLLALGLSLASCATQTIPNVHKPPGFLMGLLHGFISLFSLIGSLFFDIRIYGFPNGGSGYDVGFVIGAAVFYGGIAALAVARSQAKAPA